MAMHAGLRQGAEQGWEFGARAQAWERGAMDAEEAAATAPEAAATAVPEAAAGVPEAAAAATGGVAEPIDVTQVRGPAWSHGVYRLFVRGRAVRGPAPTGREWGAQDEGSRRLAGGRAPAVQASAAAVSAQVSREVAPAAVATSARGSREVMRAEPVAAVVPREVAPAAMPAGRDLVERPDVRGPLVTHAGPVRSSREGGASEAFTAEVRGPSVEPAREGGASEGWQRTAGDGAVRRVVAWPLACGARTVLGARVEVPDAGAWRRLVPTLAPLAAPADGESPVVFLDVETTALDRGAGALAFMIGLAAFVGDGLQVEQWILTRLSAEAAVLAEVAGRIAALAGPGTVLASFNGASFDVPLLRMRMQRARLDPGVLARGHVDLLHPARRLWQGRERDCRLATLERTRLGVRRIHDLAGHEIPAVFWAWLRKPEDPEVQALMHRAADHNLADLVTLPALGAAIGRSLAAPADLEGAIRGAQQLVACGRRAQALALLASWLDHPGPPALRRRALLLAAELLRRRFGALPGTEAPALWAEVCRIAPGDPTAHEALAKHLEHRVGDLEQALAVARASAAPCPRRVARLQRKLAAQAQA
ncbi:MAG: ribonuclease H-like domain-containing protein [Myxococcales bacterium]|nr:ribonuclease H-like domain-containing protein [Myxococcales bacterium]